MMSTATDIRDDPAVTFQTNTAMIYDIINTQETCKLSPLSRQMTQARSNATEQTG